MTESTLVIPDELLPQDGRFGSGPTKVRTAAWLEVSALAQDVLGTSHRSAPVKALVARLQSAVRSLYGLPDDYQVVLGNGGASTMWDALCVSVIEQRSAHAVCGVFSERFADVVAEVPFLADPIRQVVPPGQAVTLTAVADVDTYALPHHETSTGVVLPMAPIPGAADACTVVDGTSAAGAIACAPQAADVYYFSLQKGFAAEGGLWVAWFSPKALDRVAQVRTLQRWQPRSLNLHRAITESAQQQTLNTPAISTVALAVAQAEWVLAGGGLTWAAARSKQSADLIYSWAECNDVTRPYVSDQEARSPVVATINFDHTIDVEWLISQLAANRIVGVDPYRKLGENQLRIGVFPAVAPADVQALLHCLDWLMPQAPACAT